VPQGSVLGPKLFTVYTSPIGDVIKAHGVQYQQYADNTQLLFAMRTTNADARLAKLDDCTTDVKQWLLANGLLLNANKSEVILAAMITTVSVAGAMLQIVSTMKTLGVVVDQ